MKKIIIYLLLLTCSGFQILVAQTVTGTVTDSEDGQVIPGVTIQVKGSFTGTTTDMNGNYSIDVPSLEETLVFSFIGYRSVDVPLDGRTTVDVSMETDIINLDEVMVVAYGTAKKTEFTGSASVAQAEDLEKAVTTSVTGALQGTVSGVQVANVNSRPGTSPQILIRGLSSINGATSPLYVVNGAPFGGDLNSININDVESISILKDASATALYGSRASAGVVVITTKQGVAGKPVVKFKVTRGISDLAMPLHKRVDNAQYYEMRWEAGKNGYLDANPTATLGEAEAYATSTLLSKLGGYNSYDRFPLLPNGKIDPDANPRWATGPTNWEDAIIQPAPRSEYYLGISGGTEEGLNYNFSLGYLKDEGAWSFSGYDRFSGRLDVSKKINDIIEVGLNASLSYANLQAPNQTHNFRFITDMPDIYPVYQWDDANETYLEGTDNGKVFDMGGGNQFSYNGFSRATWANIHPLQQEAENIFKQQQNNVNTRAYISITPIKGLNFRSSLSADYQNYNWKTYWSSHRSWARAVGGSVSRETYNNFVYTFSNLISYTTSFGNHNINILGGMEAYSRTIDGVSSGGIGFALPNLTELGAASLITGGNSWKDNHRIESYLSKFDYNYLEKYFLSASYRRDGTSRFASESRWGNFGSVGASWRITKEDFLVQTSDWLQDLTLRASWGVQGNERIGSYYAHLGTYDILKDIGSTALLLNTVSNRNLRWESNRQTNIGLSANLFGRISVGLDYFVKDSEDLLFSRELPLSSGLEAVDENIGDVRNTGFEVELHTFNMPTSSQFKWETFINLSHYKNEITRLPADEIQAGYYRYKVGKSVFEYYLREWRGVNPDNGAALWSVGSDGETTEDVNEATLDFRGTALPDLFGNVMNTFNYKGVDLSFNIAFSIGGQIYDYLNQRLSHAGARNIAETFAASSYDYWTPENTDATMTRLSDYGPISNAYHQSSTRYLWDRTYARLRNVTLGYTLPENIVSRVGLGSIRIYMQADNQMTWFKGKEIGLDPEQQISGQFVFTNIPPMKTIIGGLNVTF